MRGRGGERGERGWGRGGGERGGRERGGTGEFGRGEKEKGRERIELTARPGDVPPATHTHAATHLCLWIKLSLGEHYREHSVRSRTLRVHLSGSYCPGFVSLRHQFIDVFERVHCQFGETFDIGTQTLVFSDF